jgi:FAD/FMN-containing dehydrogenase
MLTTPEIPTPTGLAARVAGRVVHPSDPGWDAARQAFDLTVDLRPAAVAFPRDEGDVIAIVDYAREHGLRIAPQSTGHNAGPLGALDDTLLVNVRELDQVSIDPHALRVRVGAGVRWRDVVPRLSELGLAALHGSSPDVGISGYSLGGGMGWLARRYGLQTNSVTAIELVTADGRPVRADATHEPDLFWALRGGGGNFGVVTAIEFAVYPVEDLYAGVMFFPAERWGDVLHTWTAMMSDLPDELMTWVSLLHFPDMPDVPEPLRDRIFTVVFGALLGDEDTGRTLLHPIRALGPVMDTFAMVPPAELADMAMDPREPLPFHTATGLLGDLPAAGVDALVAATGGGAGTRLAMVQLRHLGGALGRTPAGAGARTGLPGEVCWFAGGLAFDEAGAAETRRALGELSDALLPHRVGQYPNFVEEPADTSEFFDPDPWVRLQRVKAAYDPGDLFRGNHHVPPGTGA